MCVQVWKETEEEGEEEKEQEQRVVVEAHQKEDAERGGGIGEPHTAAAGAPSSTSSSSISTSTSSTSSTSSSTVVCRALGNSGKLRLPPNPFLKGGSGWYRIRAALVSGFPNLDHDLEHFENLENEDDDGGGGGGSMSGGRDERADNADSSISSSIRYSLKLSCEKLGLGSLLAVSKEVATTFYVAESDEEEQVELEVR
jgi:hypothetical protein